MTAKRKPMRSRNSAPPPPEPTANQVEEAMIAFARAKVRYRLIGVGEDQFMVEVRPAEMFGDVTFMGVTGLPPVTDKVPDDLAYHVHRFKAEADARRWREREIIREAITAGMRARP